MSHLAPWHFSRGARRFPKLAHEHDELRAALRKLDLVAGQVTCPPPGHAFLGIMRQLGSYLPPELAAHAAQEEAVLYPVLAQRIGQAGIEALKAQHQALQALAPAFGALAARELTESSWGAVRAAAERLGEVLSVHLDDEEAAIDRALRCAS
ncbi:MAG: Hemerythrin cation binding domain [Cyanobacteria bacterium RYN_339]|nr:Hemerythrin cation binding domain [Cyanobacteria bacterium RYN_339]